MFHKTVEVQILETRVLQLQERANLQSKLLNLIFDAAGQLLSHYDDLTLRDRWLLDAPDCDLKELEEKLDWLHEVIKNCREDLI